MNIVHGGFVCCTHTKREVTTDSPHVGKGRPRRPYRLSTRDLQIANLWNSGRAAADICKIVGGSASSISKRVQLVRKHHPDLVTRGKGEHGSGPFSKRAVPNDRLQQAINLWNGGARLAEISQVVGYGGMRSTSAIINRARHRWPEIYIRPPDYRGGHPRDVAADDTLVASWKLGRSSQEIAQELGVSAKMVYPRVSRLIREGRIQRRTRDGLRSDGPRQQQLLAMWERGDSVVEVARALGCAAHSVYQALSDLRKRGVSAVLRQGHAYVLRPETAQRVEREQARLVRLWNSGVAIKEIARELGISRQLVSSRVCKLRKKRPELHIKKRRKS